MLTQWAGRGYTYPIDENQIKKRLDDGVKIFEINQDGTMVGTIEIIYVDETQNSALIGRFVIDPELTGHGLGTAIIVRIN